jgi:hypothetical protein
MKKSNSDHAKITINGESYNNNNNNKKSDKKILNYKDNIMCVCVCFFYLHNS